MGGAAYALSPSASESSGEWNQIPSGKWDTYHITSRSTEQQVSQNKYTIHMPDEQADEIDEFSTCASVGSMSDSMSVSLTEKQAFCLANPSHPYKGEYKNGVRHGQGTFRYANKSVYEGEWENGLKHGYGIYKKYEGGTCEEEYKGMWACDTRCGEGLCHYSNGELYRGAWKNNEKEGIGKTAYTSGEVHTGTYAKGEMHGPGVLSFADGSKLESNFEHGQLANVGKYVYPDGASYEGEMHHYLRHGAGVYTFHNGNKFKGQWNMDKLIHGSGAYVWKENNIRIMHVIEDTQGGGVEKNSSPILPFFSGDEIEEANKTSWEPVVGDSASSAGTLRNLNPLSNKTVGMYKYHQCIQKTTPTLSLNSSEGDINLEELL